MPAHQFCECALVTSGGEPFEQLTVGMLCFRGCPQYNIHVFHHSSPTLTPAPSCKPFNIFSESLVNSMKIQPQFEATRVRVICRAGGEIRR